MVGLVALTVPLSCMAISPSYYLLVSCFLACYVLAGEFLAQVFQIYSICPHASPCCPTSCFPAYVPSFAHLWALVTLSALFVPSLVAFTSLSGVFPFSTFEFVPNQRHFVPRHYALPCKQPPSNHCVVLRRNQAAPRAHLQVHLRGSLSLVASSRASASSLLALLGPRKT